MPTFTSQGRPYQSCFLTGKHPPPEMSTLWQSQCCTALRNTHFKSLDSNQTCDLLWRSVMYQALWSSQKAPTSQLSHFWKKKTLPTMLHVMAFFKVLRPLFSITCHQKQAILSPKGERKPSKARSKTQWHKDQRHVNRALRWAWSQDRHFPMSSTKSKWSGCKCTGAQALWPCGVSVGTCGPFPFYRLSGSSFHPDLRGYVPSWTDFSKAKKLRPGESLPIATALRANSWSLQRREEKACLESLTWSSFQWNSAGRKVSAWSKSFRRRKTRRQLCTYRA